MKANKRWLLLGEASFRYSAALLRAHKVPGDVVRLVATALDRMEAADLEENVTELEKSPIAEVHFNVDATALPSFVTDAGPYERIFFLFPLAPKKGRTDLNRELLMKTFQNVHDILDPKTGIMYVALAKGQGGTEFELERRTNSFEIDRCASMGGMYLKSVQPFETHEMGMATLAPHGYVQTGRRGNNSTFRTDGALMHELVVRESGMATIKLSYAPRDVSFWHSESVSLPKVCALLMQQPNVKSCIVHDTFSRQNRQSATLRMEFEGFLSPLEANSFQDSLALLVKSSFPDIDVR